jgi:hypothetical protein
VPKAGLLTAALTVIDNDSGYYTSASYSADAENYPDHQMPFVDKHMFYLRDHPELDLRQYIANIRLMTRVR